MKDTEKLCNSKIGIIGFGYIGSNLYHYLNSISKGKNISIVIFKRNNLEDIGNYSFDYIFNCAGNSGDFRNDLLETVESNVGLTTYLLKNSKVKTKLVYLSSTRIYGFSTDKNVIFNENSIVNVDNKNIDYIYDGTKLLTESILLNYSKKIDYKINIVRLSNVFGKFQQDDDATLIKKIFRYKKNNLTLTLYQNIFDSTKDYIYISDALSGIIKTATLGTENNIYNIASGKSFSVRAITTILNQEVNIIKSKMKPCFSNICIEKSKQHLNFVPSYQMESALKQTIHEK